MKQWAIVALAIAPALSACGTGIVVPDADAYVTNPFKYQTLRGVITIHKTWDEALAPIPCSNLKVIGKTWFIMGKVEANGSLYKDSPLKDPAATAAVTNKMQKHIGPGC